MKSYKIKLILLLPLVKLSLQLLFVLQDSDAKLLAQQRVGNKPQINLPFPVVQQQGICIFAVATWFSQGHQLSALALVPAVSVPSLVVHNKIEQLDICVVFFTFLVLIILACATLLLSLHIEMSQQVFLMQKIRNGRFFLPW